MRAVVGVVLALAAAVPAGAAGVNKCTDAKGRVSYQTAPCPQGQAAASMPTQTTTVPAASGVAPDAQAEALRRQSEAVLRNGRLRDIARNVRDAENRIADYQTAMRKEMDHLSARKAYATNNLAGATYEQSLSAEMQAVASKYDSLIRAQQVRIERLRADEERVRNEQ